MNKIIKISLIVSVLGLLTGCFGPSKQEIIAKEKAKKERQLKYKKIRDDRVEAKIQAKKLLDKKKAEDKAKQDATVEATGYGNTKEEALKNAFSSAVSEYVGVLVDAKEVTKNGKLIEDKILTFSNGYIDSYKTISSNEQIGFWTVDISAVIKEQDVLKQVKKLKIKAKDIKGSEDRYARLISQVKSKFDAEDMIIKLVKEYSGKNIYKLYNLKIDSVKIYEDEATRKYVPMSIKASVVFNTKEYSQVVRKFQKLFKGIGGKIVKEVHWKKSKFYREPDPTRILGIYHTKDPFPENRKIILIKDEQNAEVWQFPKSYAVIYPFKKVYHDTNWREQDIDGKSINIIGDYSLHKLFNAKVTFSDANNMQIFKSLKFEPFGSRDWSTECGLELFDRGFMIYPSNIKGDKFASKTVSYKINVPIKVIKNLKQIKIEWNNNGV